MKTERLTVTIGPTGLLGITGVRTTPRNRDRLLAEAKKRIAAAHQQLESGEFRWDGSVVQGEGRPKNSPTSAEFSEGCTRV